MMTLWGTGKRQLSICVLYFLMQRKKDDKVLLEYKWKSWKVWPWFELAGEWNGAFVGSRADTNVVLVAKRLLFMRFGILLFDL